MALPRRLGAEGLGTAFLLAVVIGSGIMGERLSGGKVAIALLVNSLATGGGLVVLMLIFGLVAGAHFNPAVTPEFARPTWRRLSWRNCWEQRRRPCCCAGCFPRRCRQIEGPRAPGGGLSL